MVVNAVGYAARLFQHLKRRLAVEPLRCVAENVILYIVRHLRVETAGDVGQIRTERACGNEQRHAQKQRKYRRAICTATAPEILRCQQSFKAEQL